MLQVNPNLSPTEIYSILQETAVDMEGPAFDFKTGFGLVDALAAVQAASSTPILESQEPTILESKEPRESDVPSDSPSDVPSDAPSDSPSNAPTESPIESPRDFSNAAQILARLSAQGKGGGLRG